MNIWAQRNENGDWRRLHTEELHSFYRSSNVVSVIKSRRLRWAGKPTAKRPLGRPRDDIDGMTILEWVLKK